jgi:hypothetical protein
MPRVPNIDFSKISFPSDGLTIRTIRKISQDRNAFAEHDDANELPKIDAKIGGLWELFNMERRFARRAFRKASTGRDDWGQNYDASRRSGVEHLAQSYAGFGIVKGFQETLRLVEEIEKQAEAQAREICRPVNLRGH